ncbi:MAG: pteridine-dependent deoxygenase like protein [Luteitalea sp.]|nr:pteridine-dependent deoxygenase like protein [Luteitalea sp.]
MTIRAPYARPPALPTLVAAPPRWLIELLGEAPRRRVDDGPTRLGGVYVRRLPQLSFVEVEVSRATALPPERFQDLVADVYLNIAHRLADEARHPVRFWSYVPDIHAPMGEGLDRYMVFNRGRYRAFTSWYGTPRAFDHTLATASAVGVEGATLTVHCLAADEPGTPIENPRQIPSYHYSTRYGPRPPCFARATRPARAIGGRELLLVGGTASIVGEESRHAEDIGRQTRETLTNLEALLAAANASIEGPAPQPSYRFTALRAYVVRADDAAFVLEQTSKLFPDTEDIEIARGEICRRELLVEVEGIAALGNGQS